MYCEGRSGRALSTFLTRRMKVAKYSGFARFKAHILQGLMHRAQTGTYRVASRRADASRWVVTMQFKETSHLLRAISQAVLKPL